MHPEIEQVGPGRLPDLRHGARAQDRVGGRRGAERRVPRHDAAGSGSAPRCRLPLLVWVDGRPPARARARPRDPAPLAHWIQLALATPVVLWAGWPIFKRCWASFLKMSPNMWTLIGIGVGAAYLYSVVATLAPGIFPAAFRGHDGPGRRLFRGRGGDRRPGPARPGAGAPGARAHQRRDQGAARPRAEDRAPGARRRRRRGGAARGGPGRATGCACARARRSRSTAWCSRAAARSTSRC